MKIFSKRSWCSFFTPLFVLSLLCPLTLSSAFAGKGSCSHVLRKYVIREALKVTPMFVLTLGLAEIPSDLGKIWRASKLLKSAHVSQNSDHYDRKRVKKANKVVDRFYAEMVALYPLTRLSRKQVVDLLDDVYSNGVDNRACRQIKYSDHFGLLGLFFPELNHDRYWEMSLEYRANRERELREAREAEEARNRQNRIDQQMAGVNQAAESNKRGSIDLGDRGCLEPS